MSLQAFNLNTIPGPQKHAGRRIMPPTNRNTQNRPLIMRQGLTIHRKAPSTAIAHLFFPGGDSSLQFGVPRDIANPANELKNAGGCQGGSLGTCHWGLILEKNGRHRRIMLNAHCNTSFDPSSQTTYSPPNNVTKQTSSWLDAYFGHHVSLLCATSVSCSSVPLK
jgi:hypothetical protein